MDERFEKDGDGGTERGRSREEDRDAELTRQKAEPSSPRQRRNVLKAELNEALATPPHWLLSIEEKLRGLQLIQ
jgi:hypothetical protein